MRSLLLIASAVVAMAVPLEAARAGGVVINIRELAASAAARGIEPVALPPSNGQDPYGSNSTFAETTASAGSGTSPGSSGGGSVSPPRPPRIPGPLPGVSSVNDESTTTTAPSGSSSGGTISSPGKLALEGSYADFGDQGCGGATAARGPLGLLPFAVAGLALLRRRR